MVRANNRSLGDASVNILFGHVQPEDCHFEMNAHVLLHRLHEHLLPYKMKMPFFSKRNCTSVGIGLTARDCIRPRKR